MANVRRAFLHAEVFDDRPEDKGGKISQRANKQHGAYEQNRKKRTRHREGAGSGGNELASERSRQRQIGTIIAKRPKSIASPSVVLYHGVLALSPAKALPLLPVAELKA